MSPARCQLRYPASDPFTDVIEDEFRMAVDYVYWFWNSQSFYETIYIIPVFLVHLRNSNSVICLGPCRFVRIDAMSRPIPAKSSPVTLAFRIRVVMAERGIRSVAALQRMLKAIGVDISVPQLIRIVDGQSTHVSTVVLGGLIAVLQCGIEDLIAVASSPHQVTDVTLTPAF
jgi:Cro/C1-type HTH DNA-binding domain